MESEDKYRIKISVRNLVEFILRSGDLDNRYGGRKDTDAMLEGGRIHRKIQKRMGSDYQAEYPLNITIPVSKEGIEFEICLEGRADGIISCPGETPSFLIDEIKGVYMELSHLDAPISVHLAQAKCYAYIYALEKEQEKIGVRMTYCNLETEDIIYFEESYTFTDLEFWFLKVIEEYTKWAAWQYRWSLFRNESIKTLEFPFSYRQGQKKLVTDVYKTIIRDKRLFIEAPTGVGKTISTIYPAIKAMGEGLTGKIFYLTAKTITRTVAEEACQLLIGKGLHLKSVIITAKEKICILDKPDCNPIACPRAKGHFDRVNDAVFDLLLNEDGLTRELIQLYAERHSVCPFEMCLDATLWSDIIICDYNYAFDPNVYLRRFFMNDKKNDYVFLIDEAHNLVERAREMYSAALYKKQFLKVKRLIKGKNRKMEKQLELCNNDLLKLKRECEEYNEDPVLQVQYHAPVPRERVESVRSKTVCAVGFELDFAVESVSHRQQKAPDERVRGSFGGPPDREKLSFRESVLERTSAGPGRRAQRADQKASRQAQAASEHERPAHRLLGAEHVGRVAELQRGRVAEVEVLVAQEERHVMLHGVLRVRELEPREEESELAVGGKRETVGSMLDRAEARFFPAVAGEEPQHGAVSGRSQPSSPRKFDGTRVHSEPSKLASFRVEPGLAAALIERENRSRRRVERAKPALE
jgi:hypothetical protein